MQSTQGDAPRPRAGPANASGQWPAERGRTSDTTGNLKQMASIPVTAPALAAIDLKPDQVADVLLGHVRAGADLFAPARPADHAPDQRLNA